MSARSAPIEDAHQERPAVCGRGVSLAIVSSDTRTWARPTTFVWAESTSMLEPPFDISRTCGEGNYQHGFRDAAAAVHRHSIDPEN